MRIATLTALLLVTEAPVMAQEADRTPQQDNGSDTSVSLLAGADYISGEIDDQDYETYAASAGLAVRSGEVGNRDPRGGIVWCQYHLQNPVQRCRRHDRGPAP